MDVKGITVEGPWKGRIPLEAIGDGYAATFAWLSDFYGWALYYDKNFIDKPLSGIVIVDEIEKHLHPRWQREIIRLLCDQFPAAQFILTSHSPICAGGVADLDPGAGAIFVLSHNDKTSKQIEPPAGWRYDQILTSSAFGLESSRDVTTQKIIDRLRKAHDNAPETGSDEFDSLLSELEARSITAAQDESDRANRTRLAEELRAIKILLKEREHDSHNP
jgi:hypothetical protein